MYSEENKLRNNGYGSNVSLAGRRKMFGGGRKIHPGCGAPGMRCLAAWCLAVICFFSSRAVTFADTVLVVGANEEDLELRLMPDLAKKPVLLFAQGQETALLSVINKVEGIVFVDASVLDFAVPASLVPLSLKKEKTDRGRRVQDLILVLDKEQCCEFFTVASGETTVIRQISVLIDGTAAFSRKYRAGDLFRAGLCALGERVLGKGKHSVQVRIDFEAKANKKEEFAFALVVTEKVARETAQRLLDEKMRQPAVSVQYMHRKDNRFYVP